MRPCPGITNREARAEGEKIKSSRWEISPDKWETNSTFSHVGLSLIAISASASDSDN
jgi:hypothetical protein